MPYPTTTPVFANMNAVLVGTGENAFNLMQYGTGWNILTKTSWSAPSWGTWWHTGHTEDEARAMFAELAADPFFGGTRYLRLVDGQGNIVSKHRRGDTSPPRYTR